MFIFWCAITLWQVLADWTYINAILLLTVLLFCFTYRRSSTAASTTKFSFLLFLLRFLSKSPSCILVYQNTHYYADVFLLFPWKESSLLGHISPHTGLQWYVVPLVISLPSFFLNTSYITMYIIFIFNYYICSFD